MSFFTAIAVAGLAATAYGNIEQTRAAKSTASSNRAIAEQELRAEEARRRAAELDARRRQLEMVRNQQKARALALSTATAQNASGGSGLQGGYGQISGDTNTNLLGVTQNLEIGRDLFNTSAAISQQRMNIAQYSSRAATGQGISSLGGAVLSSLPEIRALGAGFRNTGTSGYNSNTYGAAIRDIGRGGLY